MKYFALIFLAFSVGCSHAQVRPTAYQVALSWSNPVPATGGTWTTPCVGTGSVACTYIASRITIASGVTTCPAANVTTPNYTPLNQSSPVAATAYADTSAAGLNVCYVIQTQQASAIGNPSNTAGPFAVPAGPGAPTIGGTQTTASAVMPKPLGNSAAPVLTAKLTPVR